MRTRNSTTASTGDPARKLAKARWAACHAELRMLHHDFPDLDESSDSMDGGPTQALARIRLIVCNAEVANLRRDFPTLTDESKESRTLEKVDRALAHEFKHEPGILSRARQILKSRFQRQSQRTQESMADALSAKP